MKELEHKEQCAYMKWLYFQHPEAYVLTHATPNGGKRNIITAKKLKREGVKAGYPDLSLDMARGGYFGLRIEMKKPKAPPSSVSENQEEWGERLNDAGYLWVVCRGFDEAMTVTNSYLAQPLTSIMETVKTSNGHKYRVIQSKPPKRGQAKTGH